MKWLAPAAALVLATTMTRSANADVEPRVVIAGPARDALSARLEREAASLGFKPIVIGTIGDCREDDVIVAAAEADASAVLCSDGARVAVWTEEPGAGAFVLRDLVTPGADVAMRAAEVMRANVELREPASSPPPTSPPPPPAPAPVAWEPDEPTDRAPTPPPARVTHTFRAELGPAALMGVDTTTTTLSAKLAYGVHSRFSITARVEAPLSTSDLGAGRADPGTVRMQAGLAGVGVEVPLAGPSARVIPRLGASAGAAWVHATEIESTTVPSAAGWVEAALSVGVYGPLRVVGEAMFGSTVGRLSVVDEAGVSHAHFGAPMGALALRLEVAIR